MDKQAGAITHSFTGADAGQAMEALCANVATVQHLVDYIVVTRQNDIEGFNAAVRKFLAEDWEPLGGVSVSLSESDDYRYIVYAQAMVKYGED